MVGLNLREAQSNILPRSSNSDHDIAIQSPHLFMVKSPPGFNHDHHPLIKSSPWCTLPSPWFILKPNFTTPKESYGTYPTLHQFIICYVFELSLIHLGTVNLYLSISPNFLFFIRYSLSYTVLFLLSVNKCVVDQ